MTSPRSRWAIWIVLLGGIGVADSVFFGRWCGDCTDFSSSFRAILVAVVAGVVLVGSAWVSQPSRLARAAAYAVPCLCAVLIVTFIAVIAFTPQYSFGVFSNISKGLP